MRTQTHIHTITSITKRKSIKLQHFLMVKQQIRLRIQHFRYPCPMNRIVRDLIPIVRVPHVRPVVAGRQLALVRQYRHQIVPIVRRERTVPLRLARELRQIEHLGENNATRDLRRHFIEPLQLEANHDRQRFDFRLLR